MKKGAAALFPSSLLLSLKITKAVCSPANGFCFMRIFARNERLALCAFNERAVARINYDFFFRIDKQRNFYFYSGVKFCRL